MPRKRPGRPNRRSATSRRSSKTKGARITRTGYIYMAVWVGLMVVGLYQQANLILLIAGMAAGPIMASLLVSAAMLRRLKVARRSPPYLFEGGPLMLDYTLANERRSTAALALTLEDHLAPANRTLTGQSEVSPSVTFGRVAAGERSRLRWQGPSPLRGRYKFGAIDLVTGSPFGLMERRIAVSEPAELLVYPKVGQLSRRWHQIHRESTQTRRGRRHDRTAQQQEYHGLREYRPGDSPRWIHWRTTARIGKPMVKEFEQQNDQDLAVLVDPWLPRAKVTPGQREAMEGAIRFAATVCLESCREAGRRILLGWTGPMPGLRQGPSSPKLLHEFLEQLAVMRPATEGRLAGLLDALPPATLREALLVIVSTRPIHLAEEVEHSSRLDSGAARGIAGRVLLLDASRGELDALVRYDVAPQPARQPVATR